MAISGAGGMRVLEDWRYGDQWYGKDKSLGRLEVWRSVVREGLQFWNIGGMRISGSRRIKVLDY